ncbi:MAG: hypothetical protein GX990_04500 [Lactobacillus sp.]|nr:hypothetical protein [Lactobacillus sp.]
MIDIYNESLAKYADGDRHIFTAKFLRPDDRKGIFTELTVDNEDNVVVKQIALHMTKAFKDLNLEEDDVIQFEGIVKKNTRDEYTVERPTRAEKISSADNSDSKVHVMGNDWDWFEK